MRIAIIGAGPSGLSAALALRDRGYTDVVVFEKNDRIGGKSHTFTYQQRAYDMGSMVFHTSDAVGKLTRRFSVPTAELISKDIFIDEKDYIHPVAYALRRYSFFSLIRSWIRLQSIVKKYRLNRPGFYSEYDRDLYLPFSRFIKKHGIEPIAKAVEPASTGFGYGFYEEVPALYLVKFLGSMIDFTVITDWILGRKSMRYFPQGWTKFWETIAQDIPVRLKADIRSIRRDRAGVLIDLPTATERFDCMILTGRLDQIPFLDQSSEERTLFKTIKCYRIVSTLVKADRELATSFLVRNAKKSRHGHVIGFENYHPNQGTYVVFQLIPERMSLDQAFEILQKDCAELGSRVTQRIAQRVWDYFYYVPSGPLSKGFYQRLRQLQGKRHTYFAGSIMNFETVSHCIEFSQDLVERFFPKIN